MLTLGTIRERKSGELRVGLVPKGVRKLTEIGHRIFVEEGAGFGSGFSDEEYIDAGAVLVRSPENVVYFVDVLVKVKEPIPEEYHLFKMLYGQTIVTYFHLAAAPKKLLQELLRNCVTSIAYETIESSDGRLPLLRPMSEIAGISAVQDAAHYLKKKHGGVGITLGRPTGLEPASVVVVGGGAAGESALKTALGMGARVTLFEVNESRRSELSAGIQIKFGPYFLNYFEIKSPTEPFYSEVIAQADVLIGAVSVRGERASEVVNKNQVCSMKDGAVIVDISIDQGGCIWGSRPTTHENPTYTHVGKVYCSIANIPGQVPRQSTVALTNATFPALFTFARDGVRGALICNSGLRKGLVTHKGKITSKEVALAHDMVECYENPDKLLRLPM